MAFAQQQRVQESDRRRVSCASTLWSKAAVSRLLRWSCEPWLLRSLYTFTMLPQSMYSYVEENADELHFFLGASSPVRATSLLVPPCSLTTWERPLAPAPCLGITSSNACIAGWPKPCADGPNPCLCTPSPPCLQQARELLSVGLATPAVRDVDATAGRSSAALQSSSRSGPRAGSGTKGARQEIASEPSCPAKTNIDYQQGKPSSTASLQPVPESPPGGTKQPWSNEALAAAAHQGATCATASPATSPAQTRTKGDSCTVYDNQQQELCLQASSAAAQHLLDMEGERARVLGTGVRQPVGSVGEAKGVAAGRQAGKQSDTASAPNRDTSKQQSAASARAAVPLAAMWQAAAAGRYHTAGAAVNGGGPVDGDAAETPQSTCSGTGSLGQQGPAAGAPSAAREPTATTSKTPAVVARTMFLPPSSSSHTPGMLPFEYRPSPLHAAVEAGDLGALQQLLEVRPNGQGGKRTHHVCVCCAVGTGCVLCLGMALLHAMWLTHVKDIRSCQQRCLLPMVSSHHVGVGLPLCKEGFTTLTLPRSRSCVRPCKRAAHSGVH